MLKALLFGTALIFGAVLAIASTALLAVLFLFASPANATTSPSPVYLLESPEEIIEEAIDVEVINKVDEMKPVFLLEVVEQEIDLNSLTIPKLKELAKEKGIHIKSSLRKAQIIELLSA